MVADSIMLCDALKKQPYFGLLAGKHVLGMKHTRYMTCFQFSFEFAVIQIFMNLMYLYVSLNVLLCLSMCTS